MWLIVAALFAVSAIAQDDGIGQVFVPPVGRTAYRSHGPSSPALLNLRAQSYAETNEPAPLVPAAAPSASQVAPNNVPPAAPNVSTAVPSVLVAVPIDLAATPRKGPPYQPKWDSLDSRPLPSWYDEAKIGIFIHWGVYSVPSVSSEWFWIDWKGKPSPNPKAKKQIENFMKANYKPKTTYQDFAKDFTAEFFDPNQWADMIEKSGAKYVVFTSKHHEGYAMWPSKYSYSWNSVDVGPHRDVVGELRKAILKKTSVRFGLYHSLYEWFHPLYLSDKSKNFTSQEFVNTKVIPEMKELINLYKPDVLWSDGDWEAPSEYWKSQEFLAWLYNNSPVKERVVVNDRWGEGTTCKHGGMYTCTDRYNPGKLQQHKWENALTIDKNTWGFNRLSNIEDYMTTQELIGQIASTVSCGGNIVMNVGPSKDGTINPIFQERLHEVGKWLKVNGDAIYASSPWDNCQNDTVTPGIWYTVNKNGTDLYAIMLRWPTSGIVQLGCPEMSKTSQVTLLGLPDVVLKAENEQNVLKITLPDKAVAPTDWGSVLKITNYKVL